MSWTACLFIDRYGCTRVVRVPLVTALPPAVSFPTAPADGIVNFYHAGCGVYFERGQVDRAAAHDPD